MDDRARLWNLLHDGDVVDISRSSPQSVSIEVEVDFLDSATDTGGGSLTIDLEGCQELVYRDGETGEVVSVPADIMRRVPDILSATEVDGEVRVLCSEGELRLRYSTAALRTSDGASMSIHHLESTSMRYWEEWERSAHEDLALFSSVVSQF